MTEQPAAPLAGPENQRLRSAFVNDRVVPFPVHTWSRPNERIPRFGDLAWDIAGLNDNPTYRRTLDFTEFSDEWSLLAREVIYWRCSGDKRLRSSVEPGALPRRRGKQPRTDTVAGLYVAMRRLSQACEHLGLGLPNDWSRADADALRDLVRRRHSDPGVAGVAHAVYALREHLTLGGAPIDPLEGSDVYEWSGSPRPTTRIKTEAVEPYLFASLTRAAFAYIEKYSDDILAAHEWKTHVQQRWASGESRVRPTRLPPHSEGFQQGYRSPLEWEIDQFIEEHGAIPLYTTGSKSSGGRGALGVMCLSAALDAPKLKNNGKLIAKLRERIREGAPTAPGLLPLAVSQVERADGTIGPWREPWCWASIDEELAALRAACVVTVGALTGMRSSEIGLLERGKWRGTWFGFDAIVGPPKKKVTGDPVKWWATDIVIRACEILELTTDRARLIDRPTATSDTKQRARRDGRAIAEARTESDPRSEVHYAIRQFIRHVNSSESLQHGEAIAPSKTPGRAPSKTPRRPDPAAGRVRPHQLRATLAVIATTVTLGDEALQKQLKHAQMAVTWSYMANDGRDAWLDTLVDRQAVDRWNRVITLVGSVWSGQQTLSGHGARSMVNALQAVQGPRDRAEPAEGAAGVINTPELAALVRSTYRDVHFGVANHCLFDSAKAKCGGSDAPIISRCSPETCTNAFLEAHQARAYAEIREEIARYAALRNVPLQQRDLLKRRLANIDAMLTGA